MQQLHRAQEDTFWSICGTRFGITASPAATASTNEVFACQDPSGASFGASELHVAIARVAPSDCCWERRQRRPKGKAARPSDGPEARRPATTKRPRRARAAAAAPGPLNRPEHGLCRQPAGQAARRQG